MGWRRKIAALGLGLGALGVVTACEPAPPPPTQPPKTPEILISNAEYDSVFEGLTLWEVETRLRKQLVLDMESTYDSSYGTYVTRYYSYDAEFGDCWQMSTFVFDNTDADYNIVPGELHLSSKHRSQFDCEGIVK